MSRTPTLGPTVGMPALRGMFPSLVRSALAGMQQEYRRRWSWDNAIDTGELEWLVLGSV